LKKICRKIDKVQLCGAHWTNLMVHRTASSRALKKGFGGLAHRTGPVPPQMEDANQDLENCATGLGLVHQSRADLGSFSQQTLWALEL
jgi:hypothetical protein